MVTLPSLVRTVCVVIVFGEMPVEGQWFYCCRSSHKSGMTL